MAYRNMVRDRVKDSFIKDAEYPGIMHDAPPLEDKRPGKKKKKKNPMNDEIGRTGSNTATSSLLDL